MVKIKSVSFSKQVKPPFGSGMALDSITFQDNEQQKYDIYDDGDRVYISHKDRPEHMISVPVTNITRVEYFKASDAPINHPVTEVRRGPGRPPKEPATVAQ